MRKLTPSLLLAVLFLLVSSVDVAEAARKKRKGVKVGPDDSSYSVTLENGKSVQCLRKANGKVLAGKLAKTGKTFKPTSIKAKLAKLKLKAKSGGAAAKKAKKQIKKAKKGLKAKKQACANGGNNPPPPPGATPTPVPPGGPLPAECSSLVAYLA